MNLFANNQRGAVWGSLGVKFQNFINGVDQKTFKLLTFLSEVTLPIQKAYDQSVKKI